VDETGNFVAPEGLGTRLIVVTASMDFRMTGFESAKAVNMRTPSLRCLDLLVPEGYTASYRD
jgi:hypothetical protein